MVFAQSLKEYQWKNRLVFLVDESMESKTMNTQLQLFLNDSDELKERDIVLFPLIFSRDKQNRFENDDQEQDQDHELVLQDPPVARLRRHGLRFRTGRYRLFPG